MSYSYTINPKHADNERLEAFLKALPDVFQTTGEVLYQGRNVVKRIEEDGMPVLVVKAFGIRNIFQKTAYSFFEHNKARKAYDNALILQREGFLTPEPYAFAEEKSKGWITGCYLVTAETRRQPLMAYFEKADGELPGLIAELAAFFANLHKKGILHHDLNSTNILPENTPDGWTFELIDNNRMDYVRGAVPALKECYENMTRFTGDMELFKTFAGAYVACRDLPKEETGTLIATKRHHDNAYSRRKMITHPIRAYRNHKATKKDK